MDSVKNSNKSCRVLLGTCAGWHLPNTAAAFSERDALAGLWITDKRKNGVPEALYRRCWAYHIAMKPFYHLAPQIWTEHAFYAFFPIWKRWLVAQKAPLFEVVQGIGGFCTELFDMADKCGALKVYDCANSHPTTYFGHWQRECDLWCPGENVPIPRWMFARMNREIERADVILCPSLFVKNSMLANGIAPEKCFVNPFGVNTTNFVPRCEVPAKVKFIAVGTISVRKGFQYLFRAFEIVKKTLPDAELVVAGDYKCDFDKERPRWEGTFTHYQHLNQADLAKLLQTCTAFVFPSMEEGFARVIPEAMAAGLPIIASHESGATTLVENGIEGLIVNGRDPQNIADAMILAATDRELNTRMGLAAYEKGAVRNTWQDYGDRLLAEYRRRLEAVHSPSVIPRFGDS